MKNLNYLTKDFFKKNYNIIAILTQICVFYFIYYVSFGRFFISGESVFIGDSQGSISLNNLAIHSMLNYHEFLWWDPTAFNGWPAHINLTIGWFNYLSPFSIPGHLVCLFLVKCLGWSVAHAVQIQFSSVTYLLILIIVILLSRQLIFSTVGRFIPPLIFTLGASTDQIHKLIHH